MASYRMKKRFLTLRISILLVNGLIKVIQDLRPIILLLQLDQEDQENSQAPMMSLILEHGSIWVTPMLQKELVSI